jgi:hypothetical protein
MACHDIELLLIEDTGAFKKAFGSRSSTAVGTGRRAMNIEHYYYYYYYKLNQNEAELWW